MEREKWIEQLAAEQGCDYNVMVRKLEVEREEFKKLHCLQQMRMSKPKYELLSYMQAVKQAVVGANMKREEEKEAEKQAQLLATLGVGAPSSACAHGTSTPSSSSSSSTTTTTTGTSSTSSTAATNPATNANSTTTKQTYDDSFRRRVLTKLISTLL